MRELELIIYLFIYFLLGMYFCKVKMSGSARLEVGQWANYFLSASPLARLSMS